MEVYLVCSHYYSLCYIYKTKAWLSCGGGVGEFLSCITISHQDYSRRRIPGYVILPSHPQIMGEIPLAGFEGVTGKLSKFAATHSVSRLSMPVPSWSRDVHQEGAALATREYNLRFGLDIILSIQASSHQ